MTSSFEILKMFWKKGISERALFDLLVVAEYVVLLLCLIYAAKSTLGMPTGCHIYHALVFVLQDGTTPFFVRSSKLTLTSKPSFKRWLTMIGISLCKDAAKAFLSPF